VGPDGEKEIPLAPRNGSAETKDKESFLTRVRFACRGARSSSGASFVETARQRGLLGRETGRGRGGLSGGARQRTCDHFMLCPNGVAGEEWDARQRTPVQRSARHFVLAVHDDWDACARDLQA
jgi:hypothetical protein